MKKYYTYAYLREDRTPYYIGKGKGRRIYNKWIGEVSPPKDKSRIIFLKQNLTEEEAFRHEIYMIAVFGRKDLGTGILRNKTNGGDGCSGMVHSEETKEKIGNATRGKTLSKEHKEKISLSNKGKKLSEETRAKIGFASKGRTLSQESRKKMSNSRKGEKHPRCCYWKVTFVDGSIMFRTALYQWAKENGYNFGNIDAIVSGKRKRHKDIVAVEKLAYKDTF